MLTGAIALRWGTELLIVAILLSMLIQDWRCRAIYWYYFPALALSLTAARLLAYPLSTLAFATDVTINLVFVGLQLAGIWLYVQWRFRPSPGSLSQYLGGGDILYWLTTAVFFSPVHYMLYFITSLLAALLIFVGIRQLRPSAAEGHVPLAGLQAGFLAALLVANWLLPASSLGTQRTLQAYLNRL